MFIVNKNSWHYKWLKFYRQSNVNEFYDFPSNYEFEQKLPTDFCEYWRAVLLWPSIRIGFNTLLNTVILFSLFVIFTTPASIGLGITILVFIAFIAFIGGAVYVFTKLLPDLFVKVLRKTDNDEFLKSAYESTKDKFCTSVDYKDGDNV